MPYDICYKRFIENNPYPRKLKSLEPLQGSFSIYHEYNGKRIINFSSSDYLGLSRHPLLIQRSHEYAKRFGVGSGSSRLVTGNLSLYTDLEQKLAGVLQKPAALIFGTGYQTNISVLEALLDKRVLGEEPLVFVDRLCHVSMITMTHHLVRLQRFQHNDLSHLQMLLEKYKHSTQPKFILAESLYSMDGDQADLSRLVELAKQYNAFLYIDDAHAVGVYGINGWGRSVEYADNISVVMGTFSKALGSYGGYIGCSEVVRQYLINKCKGLIYSTGPSPAVLGAISAVIDLLPEFNDKRLHLLKNADKLRNFLHKNNLDYGQSTSHIIPWIIGDANQTVKMANLLEENGILGTAIQPPSVPVGKSRIRFCISSMHSDEDLEYLIATIRKVAGMR